MQHLPAKSALMKASLLFALGHVASASADDLIQYLGSAAGATDYYTVTCSNDSQNGVTHHLTVQIKDQPPKAAPWVSVQVVKGKAARNATDAVDGDAGYSPAVTIAGGGGNYLVTVDKSSAGTEYYALSYHCEDVNGKHTGTLIKNNQDK